MSGVTLRRFGLLLPVLGSMAIGCTSYGYATLPASGAATRASVRLRAEQAGLRRSSAEDAEVDRYQVTVLTEPNASAQSSPAPAPSPLPPGSPAAPPTLVERTVTMTVRTDAAGTVEFSSQRPQVFRALTDGVPLRWYRTPYAPRAASRRRTSVTVEVGDAAAPGHSGLRVDTVIRLGGVLLSRGGDDRERVEPRHALAALAGAGISFDGRGPALREELMLTLSRERLVTPMQGRELPHGPTLALDLSLAALESLDGERTTVEASLGLRVAGLAGMFARVGRQWGAPEDTGPTRMLGLQLDGSVVVHSVGFAVGAAIQLAATAGLVYLWSKGCEGHDSTSSSLCG
ncbi:MAG: hypothetical protein IT370_05470 [Deltaproteobacteria bacterium]|nr:hypothetical protein [Deltaproteobacteria bacterium]